MPARRHALAALAILAVAPATAQESGERDTRPDARPSARSVTLSIESRLMGRPLALSAEVDDLAAFTGAADRPVRIVLDGRALGHPVEGTLATASAAGMRDGSAPLEVEITWATVAYVAAALALDPDARTAAGRLDVNVASTETLLAALGVEAPRIARLHPAPKLGGRLDASPERIAMRDLEFVSETTTVGGDLALERGGERPRLVGDLDATRLTLPPIEPDPDNPPLKPLLDLIAATPLPLDVDLALAVERLVITVLDDLTFESAAITLAADATTTRAKMTEARLGEGSASFEIAADASVSPTETRVAARTKALPLAPIARRVTERRVEGVVDLAFDARTRGREAGPLGENLAGELRVTATDGLIEGFDLPAFLADPTRFLSGDFLEGGEGPNVTRYDLIELRAPIEAGVATIEQGRLESEMVVVEASGTIDLGARRLDVVVDPEARPALDERGGLIDLAGLAVPIEITGRFDDLSFSPRFLKLFGEDTARPEAETPDAPSVDPAEAEPLAPGGSEADGGD